MFVGSSFWQCCGWFSSQSKASCKFKCGVWKRHTETWSAGHRKQIHPKPGANLSKCTRLHPSLLSLLFSTLRSASRAGLASRRPPKTLCSGCGGRRSGCGGGRNTSSRSQQQVEAKSLLAPRSRRSLVSAVVKVTNCFWFVDTGRISEAAHNTFVQK